MMHAWHAWPRHLIFAGMKSVLRAFFYVELSPVVCPVRSPAPGSPGGSRRATQHSNDAGVWVALTTRASKRVSIEAVFSYVAVTRGWTNSQIDLPFQPR